MVGAGEVSYSLVYVKQTTVHAGLLFVFLSEGMCCTLNRMGSLLVKEHGIGVDRRAEGGGGGEANNWQPDEWRHGVVVCGNWPCGPCDVPVAVLVVWLRARPSREHRWQLKRYSVKHLNTWTIL